MKHKPISTGDFLPTWYSAVLVVGREGGGRVRVGGGIGWWCGLRGVCVCVWGVGGGGRGEGGWCRFANHVKDAWEKWS